jgi:predicted Rossmann fold flavoprotein
MSAPWDLIVVGAGAAGLIAAARAAEAGMRTLLLDKNRKPGVKILMSGGTRCNLTHATDRQGILSVFPAGQARFLRPALAAFGPADLTACVEAEGVALKTEPTGKIFPASDSAVDIQQAFLGRLHRSRALLSAGEGVTAIDSDPATGFWRISTIQRQLTASRLLLCSGGQSYPGCGTTGDGYRWCAEWGHTIVTPRPALVPLRVNVRWVQDLSGVTIPDVDLSVIDGVAAAVPLARSRASFLFTHFGCSGPAPLNVSRAVTAHPQPGTLRLRCDWLPEMRDDQLQSWFLAEANRSGKRQAANVLAHLLPHRFVEALMGEAAVPAHRKLSELTRDERARLIHLLKRTELPLQGALGFEKAEVTAGGVTLAEVDPRTMRSNIRPRLWLAGEILDIDGPIGGYNFQAAFSTGTLAALDLAKSQ